MRMDGKYFAIQNDGPEVLSKVKQILRNNSFESIDTNRKSISNSTTVFSIAYDPQRTKKVFPKRGRTSL